MEILVNRILVNVMTALATSDKFRFKHWDSEFLLLVNCFFLNSGFSNTSRTDRNSKVVLCDLRQYFSNCNVHTNLWRSCHNADFSSAGLGQGPSLCTCTGEASAAAGPQAHGVARRPGCLENRDLTWQALRAKPGLTGGSYKALHSSSA